MNFTMLCANYLAVDAVPVVFGLKFDETDSSQRLELDESRADNGLKVELHGDVFVPGLKEDKTTIATKMTALCQVPLRCQKGWLSQPSTAECQQFVSTAAVFGCSGQGLRYCCWVCHAFVQCFWP